MYGLCCASFAQEKGDLRHWLGASIVNGAHKFIVKVMLGAPRSLIRLRAREHVRGN
jgi:hypothetical protein